MAVRKEKEYAFTCDCIPEKSFQFFQGMRNKKEFCDVTFRLENQETIYAHRIVVAAVIPYLQNVLLARNGLQDGEEGVSIPEIDSSAFKCLIEFAYSYQLKINLENVWNFLGAACFLQVKEVQEACCDFVLDTLEFENAVSARQLANSLNCSDLVKDIDSYVAENFVKISQTEEFVNWPSTYMEEIICRDDLYVDNEQQILQAVLRWVKSSSDERSVVLPDMLRKIRMVHVEPKFLAQLTITEDIIRTSVLCRDLVDEAKNYSLFPTLRKEICSFITEPRQGMKISDDENNVYICEMIAKSTYMAKYYDLVKGQWYTKDRECYGICGTSCAKVENEMFFFHWGETVQYNAPTNEYNFFYNKPTATLNPAVATLQNKIYLFGGKLGFTASNSVECYHPKNNMWTKMKFMHTGRWGLSAVSLGNYIYVLGGEDQLDVYDYIERYDPIMDKWRSLSPMITKRSYLGTAALNGKIYICGGTTLCDCNGIVGTAEVYDPFENLSKFIAHLNVPRYDFFLLVSRGKLYALEGQDDSKEFVDMIDIYDPKSGKWTVGSSPDSLDVVSGAVMCSDMGS